MCEGGTKTTLVFLPTDGKSSSLLLASSIFLLSGGTGQQENMYSYILEVTDQIWESQKRISQSTKIKDMCCDNLVNICKWLTFIRITHVTSSKCKKIKIRFIAMVHSIQTEK